MNFVVIMTDTQNRSMVGAYGNPAVDTPNLDSLDTSGVRFDRAYTTCPLCTPACIAIFSRLHPPYNGAWTHGMTPHTNIPLMGTIFRQSGYRAAYTDKFYDMADDPGETVNRIDDSSCRDSRHHLHDRLLAEMDRTADCFCGPAWRQRPWRTVRTTAYHVQHPPRSRAGFPSMPRTVEHDPNVVARIKKEPL